jgi:SAM-dependent methyltransferase
MAHRLLLSQARRRFARPTAAGALWATAGACAAFALTARPARAEFAEEPAKFDSEHYPDGINANFVNDRNTDDVVADHLVKFEDPEARDIARAWPDLAKLMKETFPLTGATLADIGAGTGLFTAPFVDSVGETGKVVSIELSPHFVKQLKAWSAAAGFTNTEVVQCVRPPTPAPPLR